MVVLKLKTELQTLKTKRPKLSHHQLLLQGPKSKVDVREGKKEGNMKFLSLILQMKEEVNELRNINVKKAFEIIL